MKTTYALYHGDTFLDIGTAEEIGKRNNMTPQQVRYYSYPSGRTRSSYHTINMNKPDVKECVICHKEIKGKAPRLQKLEYNAGKYKQYYPTKRWDFCEKCCRAFEKWIASHNGGEYEDI